MFDGSTKTFEMLRRPDTLQVVGLHGDKVVIVEDEQPGRKPRIHFPGGRLDAVDISWEQGAQREMKEETGMAFKTWRLIDVQQPLPKAEWFVPWYLATDFLQSEDQNLDEDGEKIKVLEVGYEELRKKVLSGEEPTMQYAVPLFLKCPRLADLLALPEFVGKEVDR